MPDIAALVSSGAVNPWVMVPLALALGALHALEPGHSKSMIVAFIIAVKGTVGQAVLLGLSAAIGHSVVVGALAGLAFYWGNALLIDQVEPWLELISGLLLIALALRLFGIMGRASQRGHDHTRGDHDFPDGDTHAAHHAGEIARRFSGRRTVGNAEIVWFGLTGGLIPCPSALAVLLVCLQLRAYVLGLAMVAAFSLGIAVTMVAVGTLAALSLRAAGSRALTLGRWTEKLPFVSAALILVIGAAIAIRGMSDLALSG